MVGLTSGGDLEIPLSQFAASIVNTCELHSIRGRAEYTHQFICMAVH